MPIRRRNLSLDSIDAGVSGIMQYTWFKPAAAANDTFVASFVPTAGTGKTTTLATQDICTGLLYPRNVTATLTDANASITSFRIYVSGRDQFKNRVNETITCSAGSTIAGNYAFSYIDKITYDCAGTVTAVSDTLVVGTGVKMGLPCKIGASTDIRRLLVGNIDIATDVTMASDTVAAVSTTYSTITFTTAPDTTKDYHVEILSTYDLPTLLKRT